MVNKKKPTGNISEKKKLSRTAITKHTLTEPVKRYLTRSIKSFPYRSSGLVLFSVLLMGCKAILLRQYGFVDVGGWMNIIQRYIGWLGNDLLYCIFVWLIAHIAMRINWIPGKTICVIIMCLLLYVYGVDLFAMTNFHSRFMLSETGFFSWENAGPYMRYGVLATMLWCLGLYISVLIVLYTTKYMDTYINRKREFRLLRLGVGFVVLILLVSFFVSNISTYQQNIIQLQAIGKGRSMKAQDKPYESYYKTFIGKNKKPDIIVVFAESFSNIDSLYAGGSKNLLSGFDTIARDGMFFPNFMANGCTSDTAHVAFLQGVEPWEADPLKQDYTRYKSYSLGLPAYLSQKGYDTTFVSTVSLDFLHQKDFLAGLQFDTIIGNETFRKRKKYVFDAAPDEDLYKQTAKILLEESSKPRFIAMQTISSHKPYQSPRGRTEEKSFAYSDAKLLDFYRYLQSINYFNHGILIVVGDHRKMQAMGYDEIQRWGKSAYGKTLLAIVGKDIPPGSVNTKPLQHRDLFSSLKRMTAGSGVTLHELYNDAFDSYQGRDATIRYCQFVDRQYVATREDGTTWTVSPHQHNMYASYIRSYYEFQQGKKFDTENPRDQIMTGSMSQYPGLHRIAHQGYIKNSPPLSFDALRAAKEQGAEGIEIDISFTKDGYPVVMHGPDLGRAKCTKGIGKKYVSDFTLQEMKDSCLLYNGQIILTLQEALEKTANMFIWYFIDIKIHLPEQRKYVSAMLRSMQDLGLGDKIMFSSIDADVNYQLGSARDIIAGWEVFNPNDLQEPLQARHSFILLPGSVITPDVVATITKAKKQLIAYTINDPVQLRQLYDRGVRFVITDDPRGIIQ